MIVFNPFLAKKQTLLFPSSKELWRFFQLTEIKEFRLDSAQCSVTGRFPEHEVEIATTQMNAKIADRGLPCSLAANTDER